MKKNGKKWRKLQKENEARKEAAKSRKVGEPFSKAKNRILTCKHYSGSPGGVVIGSCHSLLIPVSGDECICTVCEKRFPIQKYEQMERLVYYLKFHGCCWDKKDFCKVLELSEGIEWVRFRRISKDQIEIIETCRDDFIAENTVSNCTAVIQRPCAIK